MKSEHQLTKKPNRPNTEPNDYKTKSKTDRPIKAAGLGQSPESAKKTQNPEKS